MKNHKGLFLLISLLFFNSLQANEDEEFWNNLPPSFWENGTNAAYRPYEYRKPYEHKIVNITNQLIELEDGSEWAYDSRNSEISNWRRGDIITLLQNVDSWDLDHSYIFHHDVRHSSVAVNLHAGPLETNFHANHVAGLDNENGRIHIENGLKNVFIFTIAPEDLEKFKTWKSTHTLILGKNNCWCTKYGYILVNVDKNHFVRARIVD
ncbi:MAG: hypothetical protein L0207_04010 [Chlamydiae bacterium]|nr:hypothetical protein [Chlamydiota bacterium]